MYNISKKSIIAVITEGIVVGIGLILFINILMYFKKYIPDISGSKEKVEIYFIAGFLFHIICEYTGVNVWYAKEYCKIL